MSAAHMGILEMVWMLIKLYATVMLVALVMASLAVVFNLAASTWRKMTSASRSAPLPRRATRA